MITKLTMQITSPKSRDINTNMSSLLHGYLINNMDDTYAHKMHESTLRPFSQYIARKDDDWQRIVSTLEEYGIVPKGIDYTSKMYQMEEYLQVLRIKARKKNMATFSGELPRLSLIFLRLFCVMS